MGMTKTILIAVAVVLGGCGAFDGGAIPDGMPIDVAGQWVIFGDVETTCDQYAGGVSAGEGAVVVHDGNGFAVSEWLRGDVGFRDLVSATVGRDSNEIDLDVVLSTTEAVEPELFVHIRAVDFGESGWIASVALSNEASDDCGSAAGVPVHWTPE